MTPPRRRRLPTGRLRLRRRPPSLPLGLPTALRRPGSAWPLAPLGLARLCGWCGRTWQRRGGGGRGREARARARLHGSGELRSLHAAISAHLDAACVDDAHVACRACSYALCRTCLDEDAAEGRTTCSRCGGEYAVPDPAHGKGSAEEEEAKKVEQHAAGGLRERVTIGSHLSDRQVFLGETGARDFDGNEIHRLVYVSREKRPGYQHHKKAGATNALASFTRAKKWVQELQAQGNPNTIMALAGNKADMLEARQVPMEEAKIYAQENGLFFMETSAKTAINVNDVFYEIAKRLLQGQQAQNPQGGMVLTQRPAERMVSSSSCCS